MSCARRCVCLLALAAAPGCSRVGSPTPQPDTDPKPADGTSQIRGTPAPAPASAARSDEFGPPPADAAWPDLGLYPDPDHRPVAIPNVAGTVTGVVANAAAGRAVVFESMTTRAGPGTRVVLCDTAAGAVASEWEIKDALVPLDLSPGGNAILARPADGGNTLVLLTAGDDRRLRRKTWAPHGPPETGDVLVAGTGPDRSRDVNWAAYAGGRIASCSVAGQLRVFDATTAERVGFMEGILARPAVCPDGKTLLALCPVGLAVLDVAAGRAVAVRPFAPPPGDKALAVSPDGKKVACAAPGRLAVLDLASGERWDAAVPALGAGANRLPPVGWAGTGHVLCGAHLFDPALPVPVWKYDGAAGLAFAGPKVLAVARPVSKATTLRAFTLPHPELAAAVTTGRDKPGAVALKAGDAVKVDVAGIPADRREEVRGAVEKLLTRAGYKVDPGAKATVFAAEEAAATPAKTHYVDVTQAEYARRPARLKVVVDGRTVWEQAWALEPESPLWLGKDGSLNASLVAAGVGNPDPALFRTAAFPAAIPGPSAPRVGFGISTFTPAGLKTAGE